MSWWLIIIAVLPGLVISYYIFYIDKFEREKFLPLVLCFVLGIASTYPGLYLQEFAESVGITEGEGGLLSTFIYAMLAIALTEELVKSACVFIFPYHRPFFNEPMDGIVYSVFVGMGFATFENILYAESFGLETILVRAVTAVPAHATFGVISGYYYGLSKFQPQRRFVLLAKGLFLAVIFHGVYDFFLLQEVYSGLMGLALLILYLGIRFSRHLIKIHLQRSQRENTGVL